MRESTADVLLAEEELTVAYRELEATKDEVAKLVGLTGNDPEYKKFSKLFDTTLPKVWEGGVKKWVVGHASSSTVSDYREMNEMLVKAWIDSFQIVWRDEKTSAESPHTAVNHLKDLVPQRTRYYWSKKLQNETAEQKPTASAVQRVCDRVSKILS